MCLLHNGSLGWQQQLVVVRILFDCFSSVFTIIYLQVYQ